MTNTYYSGITDDYEFNKEKTERPIVQVINEGASSLNHSELLEIQLQIFLSFCEGDPQNLKHYLSIYPDKKSQLIENVLKDTSSYPTNLQPIERLICQRNGIFIVEDEPDLQLFYKKILESQSFKVTSQAYDGLSAISQYQQLVLKPSVVLLDINLPKISGLEVAKKILSIDPYQPIIFITGNIQLSYNQLLTTPLKTIPIIFKPFSIDRLVYKIREVTN